MKKYFVILSMAALLVTSVAQAQNYTFSSDLRVGSNGSDLVALQSWLVANGFDIPAITLRGIAKGYFGEQTRAAVSANQRSVGLPSFGFFGPLTRGLLNGL